MPTDKMELMALALRCEQATGADRDIDGAVELARTGQAFVNAPAYTASLDVAMTLFPEGMREEIEITTLYQVARVTINMNHGPDDGPHYGSNQCNSIPLAICAAALRALAAQEKGEG